MKEAQTRLNKIAPKLRNVGWGIDRLQGELRQDPSGVRRIETSNIKTSI
jgi:hypothetical protein